MITIYYDGKCGICKKEIEYYKKISSRNIFKWCDIANNPELLRNTNIKKRDALLYLHAIDSYGDTYIGVDAFIIIWKNIKMWKLLAYFVSLPLIKKISNYFYKKFAKYRFSKLEHCKILNE